MIISVINQKGGVGKTTTAINLAAETARAGIATLLVDLDAQGNASSGVGIEEVGTPSLYQSLATRAEIDQNEKSVDENQPLLLPEVQAAEIDLLSILSSNQQLAGAEVELAPLSQRNQLRSLLSAFTAQYPLIVIDTAPSLSVLTINALVASNHLIIPVQCEYYALEGLGHLLRTLEMVKRQLNPDLKVLGILRTMFDGRLGLSSQVSSELDRHFPQLVFETIIPRNVRLAEAPSFGKPIALYDGRSRGAVAYERLAEEVLQRLGIAPNNRKARKTRSLLRR